MILSNYVLIITFLRPSGQHQEQRRRSLHPDFGFRRADVLVVGIRRPRPSAQCAKADRRQAPRFPSPRPASSATDRICRSNPSTSTDLPSTSTQVPRDRPPLFASSPLSLRRSRRHPSASRGGCCRRSGALRPGTAKLIAPSSKLKNTPSSVVKDPTPASRRIRTPDSRAPRV